MLEEKLAELERELLRQREGAQCVDDSDDVTLVNHHYEQVGSGAVCPSEEGEGLPSHAAPQSPARESPSNHRG